MHLENVAWGHLAQGRYSIPEWGDPEGHPSGGLTGDAVTPDASQLHKRRWTLTHVLSARERRESLPSNVEGTGAVRGLRLCVNSMVPAGAPGGHSHYTSGHLGHLHEP